MISFPLNLISLFKCVVYLLYLCTSLRKVKEPQGEHFWDCRSEQILIGQKGESGANCRIIALIYPKLDKRGNLFANRRSHLPCYCFRLMLSALLLSVGYEGMVLLVGWFVSFLGAIVFAHPKQ